MNCRLNIPTTRVVAVDTCPLTQTHTSQAPSLLAPSIDCVHHCRGFPVSGCCAHPAGDLVVTTTSGSGLWGSPVGQEGQLKVWTCVQGHRLADGSGLAASGGSFWRCSATLGFKGT